MWFVFGTLFVYSYVFWETLVFVTYFGDEDWYYLFIMPKFALWIVFNFFCSKNYDEAEGGLLEWHCLWSETYMWLSALLNGLSLRFEISILSHINFPDYTLYTMPLQLHLSTCAPFLLFSSTELSELLVHHLLFPHSSLVHTVPFASNAFLSSLHFIYFFPTQNWLYALRTKMEKLYRVSKNKTGSWLWLRSWTPYCQIQTEIEESRENH